MKVTVSGARPERKVVAVLGTGGGLFLRSAFNPAKALYIAPSGTIENPYLPFDNLLKDVGRSPIYEGDVVTLEF